MATANKYLNNKFLKTLEPLSQLSIDKLTEISNKSTIEVFPAGRTIFRQGEKDKRSYYLVSGQIDLHTSGETKPETIKAKTPETKYPITQQLPRPSTAKAKTSCEMISIDISLLEMLLESDGNPSGHYEVTEINTDDENGWMLKFLQSRAFLQIPTENIQKILMSMTEVSAKKGEVVVQQGQNNDFYYIVKSGKCSVSRRPSPNAEDVQIAILAAGDGFGEEALITEGQRNASVRMLNDGTLMRLAKEDFISLLVEPLLDYIHLDELTSRTNAGDLLVDVRQHKDFMSNHLDGAINTPLSMIRLKLNTFNTERNVIVYCNDASRSTAAAFLLIQHGLSCSILKDGLGSTATATQMVNKSNTSMTDIINNLEAVTNRTKESSSTNLNASSLPIKNNKSNKIKKQIDQLNINNKKEELAQKLALEKSAKLKEQEKSLQEAQAKLQQEAKRNKQALKEKARLEQEKLNLEQEAQTLRKKAKAEKLAAEQKAQTLREKAKAEKLAAEQEAQALREKAEAEKLATEQEAQALREKAEAEKLATEQELQKLAAETKKHKDTIASKQRAEYEARISREKAEAEKLAAELALQAQQKQAQEQIEIQQKLTQEAHKKIQLESEKIRQQADAELAQLRAELQKTRSSVEERVKALKDKEHKQAEEEIRSRQQHANDAIKESIEQARQQAALEAEKVRQQALQEAQSLQKEIEIKKQQLETEAKRIRVEAERDRAATLELARKQAQEIVLKTTEEVEFINIQRQELDTEAKNIRLQAEAERHATLEAAKQEAHSIVRKTAEEAQQLDLHRQRIEDEVSKIKAHAENERDQTLQAAKLEAANIRSEAEKTSQLKAEQDIEQIRNKTLQQAQELEQQRAVMKNSLQQADDIRIQAEKDAEKARLNALQSANNNIEEITLAGVSSEKNDSDISYSNITIPGNIPQQITTSSNSVMVESEAKSLAQEIVSKLEKAESNRIKDQHSTTSNNGLSLASASLKKRSDGKIILEGEEDIFIFKEPKSYSDSELAELEEFLTKTTSNMNSTFTNSPVKQKSNTELPEFKIDEPEFDLVDELPSHLSSKQDAPISEFSDFELHQPIDIKSRSKSISKRPAQRIVAIAASLFVAIGVGITFMGVNSEQATNLSSQAANSFNATQVSGIATNNVEIDRKVMSEAELEFEKLLKKWKKSQVSNSTENTTSSDQSGQ